MVAFDFGGRPAECRYRFDDIGIKRPLGEKINAFNLKRLGVKNIDKFMADYFTFFFRVDNAFEKLQETSRSVHITKIYFKVLGK